MSGWQPVGSRTKWTPPDADVHNAMLEAAVQVRGKIRQVEDVPARRHWSTTMHLLNDSGTDFERGDPIAVRTLKYLPTATSLSPWEEPILVGTFPVVPDDAGRVAIANGTISDGKIGIVTVSGLAIAKVQSINTSHRWVHLSNAGGNMLRTSTGGQMKIVGTTPSVGTGKYALVDLDKEQTLWRFKIPDGNRSFRLHELDGTATNEQYFTLTDPLGIFDEIEDEDWEGYVQWIDDKFYPAGAPCTNPGAV